MKKLTLLGLLLCAALMTSAQNDIADARTYGIGTSVTVTGVVTNGSELGNIRYMQDGSAGIAAYGSSLSSVSRGDSITVTGDLSDFSGLLEISPIATVTNHGPAVIQPNPLQIPITSAGESLESQLIEIQNVSFVQSGNFAGNTTYQVTDGSNTLDVRVNTGTNLVGTAIPSGQITIRGLEGQFNANYQIVPRDLNDIEAYVPPGIEINVLLDASTVLTGTDYFIGNSASVSVEIQNLGVSNLTIAGSAFTGVDAGSFSSDIAASVIPGTSSQMYTINYTASHTGTHTASIQIISDDPDEGTYTINFEAVGTDNLSSEPTTNASVLTFNNVKAYTLGGQFVPGVGADKYLVLWKNGSAITGVPADGTTYLRGDVVGDATVAYMGSGTSFTPRGIVANQDYYFAIYAFNGQGGFENYLSTSPATGNVSSLGEGIGSYYSGINATSATLTDELNALINPHTMITYFMYKQTMMNEFEIRDTTNGQSVVTCVYSGENKIFNDPFDWTPTGYSREHTYAHSWMATWPCDNPEEPEYTDQHNLFPSNLAEANTPRSNLPLGEITGAVYDTYLEGNLGESVPGGQLVYEPRESHKGNAARALMYMIVAYDFPLTGTVNADNQDAELLKTWHYNDLPDNKEIARNEYIYDLQGNRNPFIDSTQFACFIDFDQNTQVSDPENCTSGISEIAQQSMVVYPMPSSEEVFVQVNGTTITAYSITDLFGRVVLSVSDLDASKIEIKKAQLQAGAYWIQVQTPLGNAQKPLIIR